MLHVGLYKCSRSKYWYVDIPAALSPTGKRLRKSTGTKDRRIAERIRSQKEDEIIHWGLGYPKNPEVEEFLKAYLSYSRMKKDPKTTSLDERTLTKFIGRLDVSRVGQITRQHVEAYLGSRRKAGKSSATIDQDRRVITTALNWALKNGLIARNPATGISLNVQDARKYIFSDAMLAQIFDQVRGDPRHRDLWLFLLYSGMRISEALAVQWEDVGPNFIEVRNAKGGRVRKVPLTEALRTILQRHVESRPYVFGGAAPFTTRKITLRHLLRLIDRINRKNEEAAQEAGEQPPPPIKGSLHTFKATYVTRALESGVPVSTVSSIVGTSEPVLKKHYSHLTDQHLQTEAERVVFDVGFIAPAVRNPSEK